MSTQVEVVAKRGGRAAARRWAATHPWRVHHDRLIVLGFMVAVLGTGLAVARWPNEVPPVTLAPWVVLAALFLSPRWLAVVYAVVTVMSTVALPQLFRADPFAALAVLGLGALMIMMFILALSRSRLGISGFTGENLLVDLRDRLASGGELPELPADWSAQHAVHSANGEAFSGDFLISALGQGGHTLEIALVDVSGKGRQAGSRSLHLSGAFGGLLGSVPATDFLRAANTYLVRQQWDEGFATAVHVEVDLETGVYSVGRAGHPPPAAYHSGSGSWALELSATGPLLGGLADADFTRCYGHLDRGDALLLYTDGVIEAPGRDLYDGVDRMLGVASKALLASSSEVAEAVCRAAHAGMSDDRAACVIRRG